MSAEDLESIKCKKGSFISIVNYKHLRNFFDVYMTSDKRHFGDVLQNKKNVL